MIGTIGTGRTQLCHQLCVNIQLPLEKGGMNAKALYLDTTKSFQIKRIREMTYPFCTIKHSREFLENIYSVNGISSEHVSVLLREVSSFIKETQSSLLVIDNLDFHYTCEAIIKKNHASLHEQWVNDLQLLEKLLENHPELIIVYTTYLKDTSNEFFKQPERYIKNKKNYNRIQLKKGYRGRIIALVDYSSILPQNDAIFRVENQGIVDF